MMKPWTVALLMFLLGAGVTAVIVVMTPTAWRIIAGAAGLLIVSKLAAVSAAAWRERGN